MRDMGEIHRPRVFPDPLAIRASWCCSPSDSPLPARAPSRQSAPGICERRCARPAKRGRVKNANATKTRPQAKPGAGGTHALG